MITAISPVITIKPAPTAVVAVDLVRVADNGRNMHIIGIVSSSITEYITEFCGVRFCSACQDADCNHIVSLNTQKGQ
jgi:hypothetical protein